MVGRLVSFYRIHFSVLTYIPMDTGITEKFFKGSPVCYLHCLYLYHFDWRSLRIARVIYMNVLETSSSTKKMTAAANEIHIQILQNININRFNFIFTTI